MSGPTTLHIPELAGLATYEQAARIGLSVEENVRRLVRYHWVERRLLFISVAHLPATPEWEVKCALALHQWQDAGHADALRRRIAEMRHPAPSVERAPDAALDAFLEELLRAEDTVELLTGLYRVARPALADAYKEHLARTNPLADHPSRRLLRTALDEEGDAMVWGARALSALLAGNPEARRRSERWEAHLRAYLMAADGIAGRDPEDADASPPLDLELPPARAAEPFVPDMRPRRDARFRGQYEFDFPPHVVYNAPEVPPDERGLALLCKRALEMDVPEMMASVLVERAEQPWEFTLDWSRQLWDEARHAMLGTVGLAARGVDWTALPLNIGFSLRLNLHATPEERQLMLFAIEQSLMPGDTGKRFEYETAVAAADPFGAHVQDYDWADEVLHAQIGRRWQKAAGVSVDEALERARAIHERTWAALDRYRPPTPAPEWWGDFVRRTLGKESAFRGTAATETPKIIAE